MAQLAKQVLFFHVEILFINLISDKFGIDLILKIIKIKLEEIVQKKKGVFDSF